MQPGLAPALEDSHVLFDSDRQRLYLLGTESYLGDSEVISPVRTTPNVLHMLSLETGAWTRIGRVEALGDLGGYSASLDPLKGRALIAGGGASEERGRVFGLDLDTGQAYLISDGEPGLGVARRDHGA